MHHGVRYLGCLFFLCVKQLYIPMACRLVAYYLDYISIPRSEYPILYPVYILCESL